MWGRDNTRLETEECGVQDLMGSLVSQGHTKRDNQPAVRKSPTHHPQRHCPLGTISTHQRAIEQTREDALEVLDPKYMVEKRLLPPRWMDVGEQPGCFYP